MRSIAAAAMALVGITTAGHVARDVSAEFRLHVVNSDETGIYGWAVVNAHVAAATNVLQIQRPTAYQSDISYLNGTELIFDLPGASFPYSLRIPDVEDGTVGLVTSQIGDGTPGFSLDVNNYLVFNGQTTGWYACPVDGNFELYYGANAVDANLPSTECECFEFVAGFI
ncbi:hypothetical protein F5Y18DRAFT_437297 [Xylariaceae sp. FL1019]|nr:hypothetical protein F5Y18DRAFT_437297 [Xylariaceae sp. FL1019]